MSRPYNRYRVGVTIKKPMPRDVNQMAKATTDVLVSKSEEEDSDCLGVIPIVFTKDSNSQVHSADRSTIS